VRVLSFSGFGVDLKWIWCWSQMDLVLISNGFGVDLKWILMLVLIGCGVKQAQTTAQN
jgi:hypothetical protein